MSQTKSSARRSRRLRVATPTPSVRQGSGEPLLLIHPFTTSHDVWSEIVPTLAREFDVVAATLPGHWGGPHLRRRDTSIEAFADGVEQLLDELGWDTCHVAGNSIGGWLALELARRGRARSVVAIAPAGAWTKFSRSQMEVGLKFAAMVPLAFVGHALGEAATKIGPLRGPVLKVVSHRPGRVSRARADNFVRAASNCSAFLPFMWADLRDGGVGDLAGVEESVPVRLVLCGRDRLIPPSRFGTPFVTWMPGCDVVTLPDVGHVPMFEAPELVTDTILEHVRLYARVTHAETA